jgi:hypothetical protein
MPGLLVASHELRACVKNLDCYARAEQKQILERLAFDCFMRKGFVPPELLAWQKLADVAPLNFKFNPYHDELGRFTFAPGGPADDKPDDNGDDSGGHTPITNPGAVGGMRLVQEEIPPLEEEIPITPTLPKPPFDKLPEDPTQPPAPGFQWKGNGPPESGQGNWYNPKTGESLHPDMGHGPPEGPHWDYIDPEENEWRLFPDGRMEPKIIVGGEIV